MWLHWRSFLSPLSNSSEWLHHRPWPYAKRITCPGSRNCQAGHYYLSLSPIVHTSEYARTDVWKLSIDHPDETSVQQFLPGGGDLWERPSALAVGGSVSPGWEQSCTREQARQESNLQLPHLFPPFHCMGIESDFIQIRLNALFCMRAPFRGSCGDFLKGISDLSRVEIWERAEWQSKQALLYLAFFGNTFTAPLNASV